MPNKSNVDSNKGKCISLAKISLEKRHTPLKTKIVSPNKVFYILKIRFRRAYIAKFIVIFGFEVRRTLRAKRFRKRNLNLTGTIDFF